MKLRCGKPSGWSEEANGAMACARELLTMLRRAATCAAVAVAVLAGCRDEPPKGQVRLVYEVVSLGRARDSATLADLLARRIEATGTETYHVEADRGAKYVEITMTGATPARVAAVKRLLGLHGPVQFRICADPKAVLEPEKTVEERGAGLAPPTEYEWIPLQWNSRSEWDRVSHMLFGDAGKMERKEAVGQGAGQDVVYVILDTHGPAPSSSDESPDVELLVLKDTPDVTGADFIRLLGTTVDDSPAIWFRIRPESQSKITKLFTDHAGRRAAIVVDGRIWTVLVIGAPPVGDGVFQGFATMEERDELMAALAAAEFEVQLRLVREEVLHEGGSRSGSGL